MFDDEGGRYHLKSEEKTRVAFFEESEGPENRFVEVVMSLHHGRCTRYWAADMTRKISAYAVASVECSISPNSRKKSNRRAGANERNENKYMRFFFPEYLMSYIMSESKSDHEKSNDEITPRLSCNTAYKAIERLTANRPPTDRRLRYD